jgi:hypothetical protein
MGGELLPNVELGIFWGCMYQIVERVLKEVGTISGAIRTAFKFGRPN